MIARAVNFYNYAFGSYFFIQYTTTAKVLGKTRAEHIGRIIATSFHRWNQGKNRSRRNQWRFLERLFRKDHWIDYGGPIEFPRKRLTPRDIYTKDTLEARYLTNKSFRILFNIRSTRIVARDLLLEELSRTTFLMMLHFTLCGHFNWNANERCRIWTTVDSIFTESERSLVKLLMELDANDY